MHRRQVLFGVMGLVLAASAVRADVPKTVKIFGQEYTVIASPRTGTFKNGVVVNLQKPGGDADTVPLKANLSFAPGGTPAGDRLFVATAHQDNPGPTSDYLYMLKGTDANGAFTLKDSEATVFARGNREVGGRPQTITWLNDTDTGVKKDRNIYVHTFTGRDASRWYDLDSMMMTKENDFRALQVFFLVKPTDMGDAVAPDPTDPFRDPNMPQNGYMPGAITPSGMMIVAGQNENNDALEIGVIDPVKGEKFFPVKTDLVKATGGKIDPAEALPHSFVRLAGYDATGKIAAGDEYLMIATTPDGGVNSGEDQLDTQFLYRLRITLPADLTKDAANSIKAEVLDKVDLPALKLGQSPTAKIYGVAVGREKSPGKPVLYMADWAGNLFTLIPN